MFVLIVGHDLERSAGLSATLTALGLDWTVKWVGEAAQAQARAASSVAAGGDGQLGGGLGVHSTLDLAGRTRFGPDVEWVESVDYDVDAARGEVFYAAIRRYWPGLADGALAPGYAGIRPKIAGPEAPNLDFRIDGPAQHGVAGLVNLFGIESPGLTACLAIAQSVLERLDERPRGA